MAFSDKSIQVVFGYSRRIGHQQQGNIMASSFIGRMSVRMFVQDKSGTLVKTDASTVYLVSRMLDFQYNRYFRSRYKLFQDRQAVTTAPQMRTDCQMLYISHIAELPPKNKSDKRLIVRD